ncbi:MAG: alpha/beta hydrolase [Rhodospirillaceae bacterium]|jgi:pimeloyl-ACP methyl ester carboxylesterase|nr:alpha/beta hydrolase [Rhodospirillaceae bacterium]MBT5897484.1 alpha/beta hydrolase [Rhodospirillaceae bacterium]MBT6427724.1 alpha/beta hydrolase [Rhodospirillaceae bacterium]MBT7759104.1 alpha/beta hydrolase [Rhodospirillaceae bacterium]
MPHIDRDQARIYYEDSGGDGMPILLGHGFGASTEMWRGQVEEFSDRYRIITWDMRGHGQTECPDDLNFYSQDHTTDDMAAVLDHLGLERAVIGGHSLTGFMTLAFNVRYPGRATALYLQGCGPGYRSDTARVAWNKRAEARAQALDDGGLDALGGVSEVHVSSQRTAKELALAARGILSQVDARVIDSLPSISVPVLIVVGEGDTYYLDGSDYMASRIPNAVNVRVADAGHGVNVDQPGVVNEALGKFLGSL